MKESQPVGMILVLEANLPSTRRNRLRTRLQELGLTARVVEGERTFLEVSGDVLPLSSLAPQHWEGVAQAIPLTSGFPHAARTDETSTVVEIGESAVGGGNFAVVAGPCAIESEERALRLASTVASVGASAFRGGAFKPRTSPYAFQGLEEQGLEILRQVKESTGLPVVTEVLDPRHLDALLEVADVLQVGSRNMHNYALLKALSTLKVPVLLKRGFAATVDELLLAAEYVLSGGNHRVILCERGVRSAAGTGGVVLDLGAVPEIQRRSHLPVMVDPSHGTAAAHRVAPLALAAVAAGADGLLIEVHDVPEEALSDGRQALRPAEFGRLITDVLAIRRTLGDAAVDPGDGPRLADPVPARKE